MNKSKTGNNLWSLLFNQPSFPLLSPGHFSTPNIYSKRYLTHCNNHIPKYCPYNKFVVPGMLQLSERL